MTMVGAVFCADHRASWGWVGGDSEFDRAVRPVTLGEYLTWVRAIKRYAAA